MDLLDESIGQRERFEAAEAVVHGCNVVHHLADVARQLPSIGVELVGQHVVQRALRPFDLGAEDGLPPDVHRHEQIGIRTGEADSDESTDVLAARCGQRPGSAERA